MIRKIKSGEYRLYSRKTDPTTGKSDIDHFTDFMRMLAPPPVLALTSAAKSGADVFVQVGCHACHQPTMVTGASTIAPLWGLRARTAFLHDGRAATVDSAIRQHDGEAARARDRYVRLNPASQTQLLQFLGLI